MSPEIGSEKESAATRPQLVRLWLGGAQVGVGVGFVLAAVVTGNPSLFVGALLIFLGSITTISWQL